MLLRANRAVQTWCTRPVKQAAQHRRRMSTKAAASLPDKFDLHGKNVLVTGANRGIGLELARQLLQRDNTVAAGVRDTEAEGLKQLQKQHGDKLLILHMDASSKDSIAEWVGNVAKSMDRVDVVFNNAGIARWGGLESVDEGDMIDCFKVNTLSHIFVVQALLKHDLLKQGSLIASLTSLVASIEENEGGSNYAYRCSKIAANMASKSMSIDLAPRGITSTILHPGYVRTDMTRQNGLIDVDESVTGMLAVLESGKPLNGEWYHTSGRHLPW